jgi:hypothetical protein
VGLCMLGLRSKVEKWEREAVGRYEKGAAVARGYLATA